MEKWIIGLCIFLTSLVIVDSAHCQHTQQIKKISLPIGAIKMKEAFSRISHQTGCSFSYNSKGIIDTTEVTNTQAYYESTKKALDAILPNYISYKIIGQYIILKTDLNVDLDKILDKGIALEPIKTPNPPLIKEQPKRPGNLPKRITNFLTTTKKIESSGFNWNLEVDGSPHFATVTNRVGWKNVCGLFTGGYDYHGTYHIGIGIGWDKLIAPNVCIGIDLNNFVSIFGKSVDLEVQTYTTVLSPTIQYIVTPRIKLIAGPSLYLIRSKLDTGAMDNYLGSKLECGATIGVRLNLVKQ